MRWGVDVESEHTVFLREWSPQVSNSASQTLSGRRRNHRQREASDGLFWRSYPTPVDDRPAATANKHPRSVQCYCQRQRWRRQWTGRRSSARHRTSAYRRECGSPWGTKASWHADARCPCQGTQEAGSQASQKSASVHEALRPYGICSGSCLSPEIYEQ